MDTGAGVRNGNLRISAAEARRRRIGSCAFPRFPLLVVEKRQYSVVKVLFIDDDSQAHKTLTLTLPETHTLISAYTGAEGVSRIALEKPDVVLLDINLPDVDGIRLLKEILARPLAPPVVMLTALRDVRLVKEAIQAGAHDYIVKPYILSELEGTLRNAIRNADSRPGALRDTEFPDILGESGGIREVKELILRYGPSDSPVLIQGESGTGKELVARSLHQISRRASAPYVAINCGALAESLVETELFGSEKGAFTDAVARPGSFERANGGTLFLDEIGELSSKAQTRLLRVLEEKALTRVGGTRRVESDVRVVSATNKDLKSEVRKGSFREDLYYRLSVLPIRVPPLRERKEDIPLIAVHLLGALSKRELRLSAGARDRLISHPWPGNVRELRNVLERSLLASVSAGEDCVLGERCIVFD
jgi:DNA-binding NtrC family response regulator